MLGVSAGDALGCRAPSVSDIRTFAARVVRPEWAHRTVVALTELPEGTAAAPATADRRPVGVRRGSAGALRVPPGAVTAFFHVGVVCEVDVPAFVAGRVRGHEAVQERRVEALVRHHATTSAPPALVALLHTPGEAFTRTLASIDATPPLLDFAGPEGRRQTVWRVTAGAPTRELVDELAAADLYVADGHHRVAAALSEWREGGGPAQAGLLCIVHAMDGLRLSAFHRRVAGPVPRDQVLELLAHGFEVTPCSADPDPHPGLVRAVRRRRLVPRSRRADERRAASPPRRRGASRAGPRAVGSHRRDRAGPDLGRRPGPTLRRGRRSTLHARAAAAVGLTRLADAGEVMPPKTTYFEPKPCAGVFLRPDAAAPASMGDVIQ